jgi:hypothetical protein
MEPTLRDRFALGGGVIQGEKVGDRENFGAPKTGKREELRNFFRSQPTGSEIDRGAVLDKIKIDTTDFTKILKEPEFKNKNFIVLEAQNPLGQILEYYNVDDFEADLKAGKTGGQIAQEIIDKNPKIGFSQEDIVRMLRGATRFRPNLAEMYEKNRLKTSAASDKFQKQVAKDVDNFIKTNKNNYIPDYKSGNLGVRNKFYNDVINFIDKKYPNTVATNEKGTVKVNAGTKHIPFIGKFRKGMATPTKGTYNNILYVTSQIDDALGIKRPKTGQAQTLKQFSDDYKKGVTKLLKIGIKKGYIPAINPKNNLPINSYGRYLDYMRANLTHPLRAVFGNLINFSPEHPGGILKLVDETDAKTLERVLPMQSFTEEGVKTTDQPNTVKGRTYDKKISSALTRAKDLPIDDIKGIKKQVKIANNFSKKAAKEFGVQQATYEVEIVDGKPKINTKYPSLTLGSSMLAKTKAAIQNFIANGSMKKPVFKKLPKKLQQGINLINQGKNADAILTSHLKDVIPEYEKVRGFKLPSFAGSVDLSNVSPDLIDKIGNVAKKIVPVLKGLGYTTGPLQTIPFIQQAERGLPVKETLITGTARLVEDTLNLPKTVANLFGSDLPYEFKFGRKLSDKLEENIPLEERQERIKQFEIPRGIVDDMELLSDQEFDKMSEVNPEKFKKLIEASEKPQIEPEEKINKPPQSLFTPLPIDKIVGDMDDQTAGALMDAFPNSSFLQYQSAVDDGFQGSFEDYLQQQSMKMARGGRVGFANGSPNPMEEMATLKQALAAVRSPEVTDQFLYDTSPVGKLEKNLLGEDGDRTLMQQFNTQFLDPRTYPYYAQKTLRGGANIPELSVRFPLAAAYLFGKGALAFENFKRTGDLSKFSMEDLKTAMEILEPKFTNLALEGKLGDVLGLSPKAIQAAEEKRAPSQKATGDLLQFGAEAVGPATPYVFLAKLFPKLPKQIKDLGGGINSADKINKEIERRASQDGVDQTRRDILIATGSGGAIALLKYLGLDNLFKTAPKAVKAAPEIVTKGGTPKYFFDFVSLIKKKGDDITEKAATLERQKVYSYNGYELTEDISTGKISIRKDTEGGATYSIGDGEYETVEGIVRKEEINYDPPETILDDKGKPKEVPDSYDEATLKPDAEGDLEDIDQGLDSIDEILELLAKDGKTYSKEELTEMGLNVGSSNIFRFIKDKKAGGGRVNFDKGGLGLAGLARRKPDPDDDLRRDPVGIIMEGEPKSSEFDNVFLDFIEEIKEKANEPIFYTDGTTYYPEYNVFVDREFNEVPGPSKGAIPVDERDQEVIPQKRLEAAGGGILKMAGDDSGPPPKSGPTPHGLPYVAKNVRPIKERK